MDSTMQEVTDTVSNKRRATGMPMNAGPAKRLHKVASTPHGLPGFEQGAGAIPYLQSPSLSPTVRQHPAGTIAPLRPHLSLPRRLEEGHHAVTVDEQGTAMNTALKTAGQISHKICHTIAPLIVACHERNGLLGALEKSKTDHATHSRFWDGSKRTRFEDIMAAQEMAVNEQGVKVGQITGALHSGIVSAIYGTMQLRMQVEDRCELLERRLSGALDTIKQLVMDRTMLINRVTAMERSIGTIHSDLLKKDEDVDRLFKQTAYILAGQTNDLSTVTEQLATHGTLLDISRADHAATDLRLSAVEKLDIMRLESVPSEVDVQKIKLADNDKRVANIEALDIPSARNLERTVAEHWTTANSREAVNKKALNSLERSMEELVQMEGKRNVALEAKHDALKQGMVDLCAGLEIEVDKKLEQMVKDVGGKVSSLTEDVKKLQTEHNRNDIGTQSLRSKLSRLDRSVESMTEDHKQCSQQHAKATLAIEEWHKSSEVSNSRLSAIEDAPKACTIGEMGKAFQRFGNMLGAAESSESKVKDLVVVMEGKEGCYQKTATQS